MSEKGRTEILPEADLGWSLILSEHDSSPSPFPFLPEESQSSVCRINSLSTFAPEQMNKGNSAFLVCGMVQSLPGIV